jgi:hypothetical protein
MSKEKIILGIGMFLLSVFMIMVFAMADVTGDIGGGERVPPEADPYYIETWTADNVGKLTAEDLTREFPGKESSEVRAKVAEVWEGLSPEAKKGFIGHELGVDPEMIEGIESDNLMLEHDAETDEFTLKEKGGKERSWPIKKIGDGKTINGFAGIKYVEDGLIYKHEGHNELGLKEGGAYIEPNAEGKWILKGLEGYEGESRQVEINWGDSQNSVVVVGRSQAIADIGGVYERGIHMIGEGHLGEGGDSDFKVKIGDRSFFPNPRVAAVGDTGMNYAFVSIKEGVEGGGVFNVLGNVQTKELGAVIYNTKDGVVSFNPNYQAQGNERVLSFSAGSQPDTKQVSGNALGNSAFRFAQGVRPEYSEQLNAHGQVERVTQFMDSGQEEMYFQHRLVEGQAQGVIDVQRRGNEFSMVSQSAGGLPRVTAGGMPIDPTGGITQGELSEMAGQGGAVPVTGESPISGQDLQQPLDTGVRDLGVYSSPQGEPVRILERGDARVAIPLDPNTGQSLKHPTGEVIMLPVQRTVTGQSYIEVSRVQQVQSTCSLSGNCPPQQVIVRDQIPLAPIR